MIINEEIHLFASYLFHPFSQSISSGWPHSFSHVFCLCCFWFINPGTLLLSLSCPPLFPFPLSTSICFYLSHLFCTLTCSSPLHCSVFKTLAGSCPGIRTQGSFLWNNAMLCPKAAESSTSSTCKTDWTGRDTVAKERLLRKCIFFRGDFASTT